jgi:hypothetical protein
MPPHHYFWFLYTTLYSFMVFSIFSFLIILLPIMYSGGIKYYLENNDGHNRSVALEEHLKLKRQVAEKKIEEAFRKKGLNKEI